MPRLILLNAIPAIVLALMSHCSQAAELVGRVVDADTGKPIPARVYVRSPKGEWLFVKSASSAGSALSYREQWVPLPGSVEKHTTLSAHPFRIELKPGKYTVTIERGKEYFPLSREVTVAKEPIRETFRLKRWMDMARLGWYSGETHVHRRISKLYNVMPAEDLNVAFPVTFWTIKAFEPPSLQPSPLRRQGPSPFGPRRDHGYEMLAIDETHVMFPRNTEYEIFSVRGQRHTLGAVFILNHKTIFKAGMPPVAEIAEQAHREGALLDLDKHNWPWSMMLVPIAKVDLYELANNSVWRTEFGFRNSSTAPAKFMQVETDRRGMTEWGWLNFGFENYYTLLNCGFRLQPTAGTASGVHPVPLGYGRVYVHLEDGFNGKAWIDGLRRGRSFVTTGPMLLVKVNDRQAGHLFQQPDKKPRPYRVSGGVVSERPLDRIEIIVNGEIAETLQPQNKKTAASAFRSNISQDVTLSESSWIAVRCIQYGPERRVRFAHTAPWHIEIAGEPIRPRKYEIEFLIRRVRDELARNQKILPPAALEEYRTALKIYEEIGKRAREPEKSK